MTFVHSARCLFTEINVLAISIVSGPAIWESGTCVVTSEAVMCTRRRSQIGRAPPPRSAAGRAASRSPGPGRTAARTPRCPGRLHRTAPQRAIRARSAAARNSRCLMCSAAPPLSFHSATAAGAGVIEVCAVDRTILGSHQIDDTPTLLLSDAGGL